MIKFKIYGITCQPTLLINWNYKMNVKLIHAKPTSFTKKETGDLITGTSLLFLNEQTGETYRHFVNDENPKGFEPKQLAKIIGKELEISTNVKTFLGNSRVVLDKIVELV